jgi:hypothetical protein
LIGCKIIQDKEIKELSMIIISRDNGKITVTEYGIVHCILDENEPTPDRPDLTYGEVFDRDLLLADYFTEENIISVRVAGRAK